MHRPAALSVIADDVFDNEELKSLSPDYVQDYSRPKLPSSERGSSESNSSRLPSSESNTVGTRSDSD